MAGIRETTQLFIKNELTPEANHQRLRDAARTGLKAALASGKASSQYETRVDGREGSIEQATRSIYFAFDYGADAAQFALDFLKIRTGPSVSGKFARSFWISVDSRWMMADKFDPKMIGAFSEIIIGNTAPQNRRIDTGFVGTTRLKFRSPVGAYDDAVRTIKRRYGNMVSVKRAYDYQFPNKYKPKHTGYRFHSPVIILSPIR